MRQAVEREERVMIDVLYGDYEGGQRAVARFGVATSKASRGEEGYSERAEILRYWDLEGLGGRRTPTASPPTEPLLPAQLCGS